MSRPQPLVVLLPERIREIAEPILAAQLRAYGPGAMEVWEEQDFDGAYSVGIRVHVREKVPARALIDANHELYLAFEREGDRRFVYLGTTMDGSEIANDQRRRA